MNEENGRKALIVLGMHRSGTSVLGGCIDTLGLGPAAGHRLGDRTQYTPNRAIIIQHEILLKNLGCTWDMVGNLPVNWTESAAAADAAEKIGAIVDNAFADARTFAVNDPRMCRLMPLWMRILEKRRIRPAIVMLVRHPWEVARSLEQQHGYGLRKGHLLWLVHNREALGACRGRDYVVLTYDGILADPVYCMEKIASRLGILFTRQPSHAYPELIDFVRADRKRHSSGSRESADDRFSRYDWIYNQFRINQPPALKGPGGSPGDPSGGPSDSPGAGQGAFIGPDAPEIEIGDFPLVTALAGAANAGADRGTDTHRADTAFLTEMFDDLLAVLSGYEQEAVAAETRRKEMLAAADRREDALYSQIYFPGAPAGDQNAYTEDHSRKVLLAPDTWQKISVFIPDPGLLRTGRLRIDPINCRGTVFISAIRLLDPSGGRVAWAASEAGGFSACNIEGSALFAGVCETEIRLYAIGDSVRILLPEMPDLPDLPLSLEIWIRAGRGLGRLGEAWQEQENRVDELSRQVEEMALALDNQQAAHEEEVFELVQQLGEARQEIEKKDEALDSINSRLAESESRVNDIWKKVMDQDERVIRYSSELAEAERRFAELHGWFTRLADLLGFDETTASSSLHLVKKSSRVFSRKAPIDEIQTVFRNFYSMMPTIDSVPEDDNGDDGGGPGPEAPEGSGFPGDGEK